MKVINLQGMTFAERLKHLEEITQDIYNHLYDDFRWVFSGKYIDNSTSYSMVQLEGFKDIGDEVKTGQLVYFAQSGILAVINQVNNQLNTFTVENNYNIKGPKGDTGEQGEQGETGKQGPTGREALCLGKAVNLTRIPAIGAYIYLLKSDSSREPVVGDILTFYGLTNPGNELLIIGGNVTKVFDANYTVYVTYVSNALVTLPDSAKNQLYEHWFNVQIDQESNSRVIVCGFHWIDTTPKISPRTDTIENLIADIANLIHNQYCDFYLFAETTNGTSVSTTDYADGYTMKINNSPAFNVECKIPAGFINLDVITFLNTVGYTEIGVQKNASYAIGATASNLVLYADENGVLLDNDTLSETFTNMVAAGSNESKILDSINKARSLK